MAFRSLAAAAAVVLALAAAPANAADTVKVAQGTLHGAAAGKVTSFKGVPFAAPPTGELRWRPPQAPAAWTGVKEATAYGPACMQMGQARAGGTTNQSEDCLTLNVWTPASAKPGQKLPVMVWIHGGAFIQGTGASSFYDGTHFAERGVVLVTVNYRLGRLGFFAHPALAAQHPDEPQGNWGIMDNIAALKWVKANIAGFGGDPSNVTVFGESAGGILVNFLMTAPEARGLFAKAISESGFGRSAGMPLRGTGRTAEGVATTYASSVGVTGTGADAAKALRALSAQQLSAPVSGLGDPGIPSPIMDGRTIPEPPPEAFAKGHEAKVPYIAGGNSWEASLFPQTKSNPDATLARLGPMRDQVMKAYGSTEPADVAQDLTTETTVIEPDRHLARLHTKNGQKAWVYYFSYVPAGQRGSVRGLSHGGEIVYVFNNLRDEPLTIGGRTFPAATPEDRKISEAAIAYWVAFAKRSDPDSAGGPAWPRFDASESVMEFGVGGPKPVPQFRKTTLDVAERIANAQRGR